MIRFCERNIEKNIHMDVAILSERSMLGENVWNVGKEYFRDNLCRDTIDVRLLPIINENHEVFCYAYQDNEANRELRMLKELRKNNDILQFMDVFPEYKEVVIYGCNELAVSFARYLEELGVTVSVIGKYWEYFGYTNSNGLNLLEGSDRLVIYAEGEPFSGSDIIQKMKKSASPEFECIDKIYEANVLEGRIQDTIGTFEELVHHLKEEQEILILGDDKVAQDAYDLLMEQGIDIAGFAVREKRNRILLGKSVIGVTDAIQCLQNPVFLNCKDTHGALGEEWTEYFDYRGYERNKQYFLIRDYMDIPTSNLVHVLHGKRVLLTGDKWLCQLLSEYLEQIEKGEIAVKYIALSEKVTIEKDDISVLVIPDYHNRLQDFGAARKDRLTQQLTDMGFVNYTEYFISSGSFALVDNYLNKDIEKYQISELTPKGILIGRIPSRSGNVFFRGIIDGHPETLCITYSDLNENLFYYCIRLAGFEADEVLPRFWEMYNEEAGSKERYFPLLDKFEASAKRLLRLKKRFTSQELFVLFHIAYAEMLNNKMIEDITNLTIYWEPHFVSRNIFPFFALWLEDKKVDGQTIGLRRNNIVRTGSCCARAVEGKPTLHAFEAMFIMDESDWDGVKVQYHYWTEYKMRFEDIKLKPREKLTEICDRIGIAWSDNMLQTTAVGKPLAYRGSVDFDLQAVFNQYADYLSEFDRFRMSIASSPYQKRYGFNYENCLKFSRRELQEMFLKPFLFEEKNIFEFVKKPDAVHEWLEWQLWNVRKHMILDDVQPEFDRFEVEQTGKERIAAYKQEAVNETIEYIRAQDKLIIYGTGRDCQGLLELFDEKAKARFLYSDRKAESEPYDFCGKKVIAPAELRNAYKNYNILVTSSLYASAIHDEFDRMGIDPTRVFYNRAEFRA
ncbi:MAG: hypothetical protein HDR28_05535 [Lachnospiraceae bacterium]|nr:hypothetical protein [Lachnospiraceae bacterium]